MASETFTFYIQPWYRKSPYFEATKRAGCKSWGLYNHMLLPTLYDDPVTEYRALLNDVTMWDVSVERCVEITGTRRVRADEPDHLSRPDDVRRVAVQVRAADRGRRRHRERPRAVAAGGEPLLAGARRQRRAAVRGRRRGRTRHGRDDPRGRRGADADPGPSFQGRDRRAVRRRRPRPPLLLVRGGRGRRHPGGRVPHGLDRRGRLRDLSPRLAAVATICGSGSGRPASRSASARSRRRRPGGSRRASSTTAATCASRTRRST